MSGYDIHSAARKGFLCVMLPWGDRRIFPALRESVASTVAEREHDIHPRLRLPGRGGWLTARDRPMTDLARAEVVHFTIRRVDGCPSRSCSPTAFVF